MPTQLPPDEVLLEKALAEVTAQIIESIAGPGLQQIPVNQMPKVWTRQRFTDTDEDDESVSTIPDPVTPDIPRTAIIEIGDPTTSEKAYSGPASSQLDITYPINLEFEVVDNWDNSQGQVVFTNSTELVKAIYMRARRAFKKKMDAGFENCNHTYLQKVSAVMVVDEVSGGVSHLQDWSITYQVTGILV